jgi:hypothetical protein
MAAIALLGVMVSKEEVFEHINVEHQLAEEVNFFDLSSGSNMILSSTIIAVCLTCVAVLFTWLTKLTMSRSVCCTSITSILFFVFFIGFLIIGSVLIVPGTLGADFVESNCKLVKDG